MLTIISSTNRINSNTYQLAQQYEATLKSKDIEVKFLDLTQLPSNFIHGAMYGQPTSEFLAIQNEYLVPAEKFVFVTPEYNGSIPGIVKLMIDASDIKNSFHHKKACLAGVSTGRAGCLRGMDHLTNILNHMKVAVLPAKIPFSSFTLLCDEDGRFNDKTSFQLIEQQMDEFLNF